MKWFWRHKVLSGIGIIVIIIIIAAAASGNKSNSTSAVASSTNNSTPASQNASGQIGQPARVGDIQWTLQAPQKEATIPAPDEFSQPAHAQGVFIVFQASVEEVSGQAGSLDTSQINLIDSKGRSYKPSDEGSVFAAVGIDKVLTFKQLNPNVPATVTCVFDVAADATGLKAEINSGGLTERDKIDIPLGI